MRFYTMLVSAFVLGGALGGCGGSSTGGTSSAPVTESQFASRFASAVCDNIGGCCKSAGYNYDPAACKSALDTQFSQLFASKSLVYDAQAAGSCLDAATGAMSSCNGLDAATTQTCQKVFTGTVAEGQPCQSDMECAPVAGAEVYCENFTGPASGAGGQSGSSQGTCVVHRRGKSGDGCDMTCTQSGTSTSCYGGGSAGGVGTGGAGGSGSTPTGTANCYTNDGLYCGANGTCTALVPIGQPCQDFQGCVEGAYCDNGTCAAKLAAGSPCSSFTACKSGTYCAIGAGSVCTNLKPDGAACSDDLECQGTYCNGGKCTSGSGSSGISQELCTGQPSSSSTGSSGGTSSGSAGSGGAFNGADAGAG